MSALETLGALYRDERGVEVWRVTDVSGRVTDVSGRVIADGVESDYDAAFIAEGVLNTATVVV